MKYNHRSHNTAVRGLLTFLSAMLVVLLAACGGGSSSNGDEASTNGEESETNGGDNGDPGSAEGPRLSSTSEPMQFHLSWSDADTVDLLYSSDPDCDWDNYSVCPDSDMLTDVSGGEKRFEAVADDFDPNTGWYFVAEADGERSNQVGARPGPATVDEGSAVEATHVVDGTLYLGGNFDAVGMATGKGTMLTLDRAQLTGSVPILSRDGDLGQGRIFDTTPDGDGGWYIAGLFDSVNGVERENLVRIRADGSVDPDWRPAANNSVWTITRTDDQLYVGGEFSEVEHGGEHFSRNRLAALDPETGEPDSDWDPGANNRVLALEPGDNLIYAGGVFSQVGEDNHSREKLAAFDPDDGAVDTNWAPEVTQGIWVYDLLHSGDAVYVGGEFSEIDDEAAENIAALDAASGDVNMDWSGSVSGDHAGALALEGDRVFVGGEFSQAGGEPRKNLAAFNADSGELVADWTPDPNDMVKGMAVHDGLLYLLGRFDEFGADGELRQHLAAVATDTGELDADWAPAASQDDTLMAGVGDISISGGVAYVGERLTAIAAHRTSVAAIDATSGIVDRDWQFEVHGDVRAIGSNDDHLYLGGWFLNIDDTERDYLAAISRDSVELDANWDPGAESAVSSFAVSDDYLYTGGRFEAIDGETLTHLARLDPVSGAVDSDWDLEVDDDVRSLLLHDGTLYAGGSFENVAGDAQGHFAAIDVDAAENDDTWPTANGSVRSMVRQDETLYIGGFFNGENSVGGADGENREDRDRLAAIDLSDAGVDPDWDPGLSDPANSIVIHNGMLMVGGSFSEAGGGSDGSYDFDRETLAAVSLDEGDVDPDWDPGVNPEWKFSDVIDGTVRALSAHDGSLFLGGFFNEAGGGSGADPDHSYRPGVINVDPENGELLW